MKKTPIILVSIIIVGALLSIGFYWFSPKVTTVNQQKQRITATTKVSIDKDVLFTGVIQAVNNKQPVEPINNSVAEQKKLQQEINPDNYKSIILEKNKPNYVKSKGTIKILFSQSATISFSLEKINSPNYGFNKNYLPFVLYKNESTIPKDLNNNYTYGKYGDYSYTFTAPEIPGKYDLVFSEPELSSQKNTDVIKKYEITVVDKVNDELLAYKIIDRTIFAKLNEANLKDWKVVSQEIKSVGRSWDVLMQINYNSCGIDWDSNLCTAKVTRGHYLINKGSGIVTETAIDTPSPKLSAPVPTL